MTKALALLLFYTVYVQAMAAQVAVACPFPKTIALEQAEPERFESRTQMNEAQQALQRSFESESRGLFKAFIRGHWHAQDLESCSTQSQWLQARIEQDFAIEFLSESARTLAPESRAVAQFAAQALQLIGTGSFHPVQLFTHSIGALPAGYDRESKGLFFQLRKINPQFWNLYFLHEFAHALDSRLEKAIGDYASPSLVNPALEIVRRHYQAANAVPLNADETEVLILYLRAGAERGIFAEFRAWVVSSYLYQLTRGAPVPWLAPALGGAFPWRPAAKLAGVAELKARWWNYVKVAFPLPDEGLFHNPLVRRAYQTMIDRVDPLNEDFGTLAEYLK